MPSTDVAPTGVGRPRRADAVRNQKRILEAAMAVFAVRGLGASVEDVARHAGVGKATVFRSYPCKEQLIEAVAIARLRWFEQLTLAALARPDAWEATVALLLEIAETQATDMILGIALEGRRHRADLDAARAATLVAMNRLMNRAKRQGTMRHDVSADDVRVLFSGVAMALTDDQQRDPKVWRRYAGLITDALRRRPRRPSPPAVTAHPRRRGRPAFGEVGTIRNNRATD